MDLPLACTLGPDAGAERRNQWRELSTSALVEHRETETGVRLTYRRTPENERRLRELVRLETDCCAFADWRVNATGGRLVMEVTADRDSVPALHSMFRGG